MIAVDTSVWISFFRGADRATIVELQRLLDDDLVVLPVPVRIELLAGMRAREQAGIGLLLSALPTPQPNEATWSRMEEWVKTAVAAGQRFGLGDLLVAAIAADHADAVWSLDADFQRMETMALVRCHRPD